VPDVVEREVTVADALDELTELLCAAAPGVVPRRDAAGRYMICREALLRAKVALPGFLIQCGSIYKFAEFISLYDPRPAARVAFVQSAIDACRPWRDDRGSYDIFQDPGF
jgi:hypothetical protein